MRKTIVLVLALSLMVALVGRAAAGKKKKPAPPPPVTFEASGKVLVPDPLHGNVGGPTSLTTREFDQTCAIPATQGLDAYVIELSDEISKVPAAVSLNWSDQRANLQMEFFGADCWKTGEVGQFDSEDGGNEKGTFQAGTKYIIVTVALGAAVDFSLKATELR